MRNKVPHIKVDAFPLVDSHFSGVGHYTLGIVQGLDEMAGEGKLTYSLVVPRRTAHHIAKYNLQHFTKIIKNPVPNKIIRGLMKYHIPFPMDLILGGGHYYFPSFLAWPMWFATSSVVIHDVTYLAVPDCVEEGNRKYLERTVPFSLKNAKTVIAVSKFSKSEIGKFYDYPLDNIYVANPSVDRRHFYRRSDEEIRKVRLKYDIYDEKYILSVGNIEPRKNYARLVEAYTRLPKHITDEYPLVIVGAGGWNNEAIKQQIQAAKEDGFKIINPKQFVADADMPALYSGAQFFVFVPIYEGFGMSPPEAFACKTPTIASDVASVPEAAGEGATYINPFDTDDILKKMIEMFEKTTADRSQFDTAMEHQLSLELAKKCREITASALTGLPVSHFKRGKN